MTEMLPVTPSILILLASCIAIASLSIYLDNTGGCRVGSHEKKKARKKQAT